MILLSVLALCALAPDAAPRPWIVQELHAEQPPVGTELVLRAHYQSLLGDQLVLEHSKDFFELKDRDQFGILRELDVRSIPLLVHCQVTALATEKKGRRLRVLNVERASDRSRFLESVVDELPQISQRRRQAVGLWAVRTLVAPDGGEIASSSTMKLFVSSLELAARAVDESGMAESLELLEAARPGLGSSREWERGSLNAALRWGADPAVASRLYQLGLVRDHDRWRTQKALLAEIGMVRTEEGELLTSDRARLREAIARWESGQRHLSLLRGFTDFQYDLVIKRAELHDGMKRTEVLRAWGYPESVTWEQRDNNRFESWRFREQQWVYFVDGYVFEWVE